MEDIRSKTKAMCVTDIPIISYHQITTSDSTSKNVFAIPLSQFKHQMRYLHDNGYICLPINEALFTSTSEKLYRRKTFVLTFDDGYEDFYTFAYPILNQYGFCATVFVITDKVFKQNDQKYEVDNKYLTLEQIKYLHKNNVSFGSHTCSHPILTQLSRDQIQRELFDLKVSLEVELGQKVEWLAYPYGISNSDIQNIAREVRVWYI